MRSIQTNAPQELIPLPSQLLAALDQILSGLPRTQNQHIWHLAILQAKDSDASRMISGAMLVSLHFFARILHSLWSKLSAIYASLNSARAAAGTPNLLSFRDAGRRPRGVSSRFSATCDNGPRAATAPRPIRPLSLRRQIKGIYGSLKRMPWRKNRNPVTANE